MIQAITINTDVANVEEMAVEGSATLAPNLACHIVRADLSVGDQLVYDNAVALFAADQYTNVTNTQSELTISRITSTPITVETEDVDFLTLSEPDKAILDALLALFIQLNEIPS